MRFSEHLPLIVPVCISAFILGLTVTFCVVASRGVDTLDGYCYGVVDARGSYHPSEEPATVTQYGTIARTPEQVHYVIDPLYIIVDRECVCEQGLEPGACDD